jgi:hypothetical protein
MDLAAKLMKDLSEFKSRDDVLGNGNSEERPTREGKAPRAVWRGAREAKLLPGIYRGLKANLYFRWRLTASNSGRKLILLTKESTRYLTRCKNKIMDSANLGFSHFMLA